MNRHLKHSSIKNTISNITSYFILINPFEEQQGNIFVEMYNVLDKLNYLHKNDEDYNIDQIIILKVQDKIWINNFFELLNSYDDLSVIPAHSYTNFTVRFNETIIDGEYPTISIIPIYMQNKYFTSIIIRAKNKEENYSTATDNIYIVNIIIGNIPILTLAEYIDKLDSNNFASLRCLFTKCIQFREELQSVKVYNIDDPPDPKYPQTTTPPQTSKHERRTS
jgi:hypothetical protein